MSCSPVIGTEVSEMANGIMTPPSSDSPHIAGSSKCVLHKEDFPEQESEDGCLGHTENHVGGERSVYSLHGLDTEIGDNVRTSLFSPHASHEMDLSPSEDTYKADSDYTLGCPADSGAVQPERQAWSERAPCELSSCRGHPVAADVYGGEEEKEKQDEEEDEKKWRNESSEQRKEVESLRRYSSSAPGPSTSSASSSSPPPPLVPSNNVPCPPHVMAQVWVRNVRGMQDSKSLDEISQACGGGVGARGAGRGSQSEGRRATISSALELEGTVSHEGDLTNFITKNLEQKIKMSSKPSLDCSDSDCSGPIYRSRGLSRRPADIPPIDPTVLVDLQRHTQEVAQSVEKMMRSLNGTIQNMTALSVGYIQTYRDSVDSLGESVDMSIKSMYTLMARCEELDRSMQPINILAAQIRDIKRTLDALEAICK
ncbi:BLOC-1 related complex subunit 6 [Syngnathoides biaculeatus]|uniref:BLOC-1 related complex subunit 6 n=1 Tax=Syngnathoides biaculeatus TaxID=300417 RepID=UPI002ADD9597|nr:BLOC-1 related complex subunit 6 [Syngnathoides biaculeatus]XP_061688794.1 BLOC-1 related complex subunit 6 [Syngnathoides biaculeatus]XP_061688804.1 BLOC-1 related complex subunit 6 [Syngnathoides biaculeatus]XP_061688811.1 BLOC-1 related complex subunit 6 [Syngnathoides biaculeatus]